MRGVGAVEEPRGAGATGAAGGGMCRRLVFSPPSGQVSKLGSDCAPGEPPRGLQPWCHLGPACGAPEAEHRATSRPCAHAADTVRS